MGHVHPFPIAITRDPRILELPTNAGKKCHRPPVTGNGVGIPPVKMLMTGGW